MTTYDKIKNNGGRLPEGVAEKVKRRGVLVVKDTIPAEEIETMVADLLKYMYDNNAFPPGKNQARIASYLIKNGSNLDQLMVLFALMHRGNL